MDHQWGGSRPSRPPPWLRLCIHLLPPLPWLCRLIVIAAWSFNCTVIDQRLKNCSQLKYPQMPRLIQMISGTLQQCFVPNISVNFIFDPSVLQTKTFHLRIVCMCLVDSAFEMTLLSATNVTIKSPTQKLSKKINKKRKKERKKQKTNKQTNKTQTNK